MVTEIKKIKQSGKAAVSAFIGTDFRFNKAVQNAEVVSFDVFDTLIFRKVKRPADILVQISGADSQFVEKRMQAEQEARSGSAKEDVTISDIYERLAPEYGKETAEQLKQNEIKAELNAIYANPAGSRFFRYLLKKGKRIVITTDMYLPAKVIENMLKKCGYRGYERIFISGECGLSKRSGNLFHKVIKETGTSNIVHIGDHIVSDYLKPKEMGIAALLYKGEAGKKDENKIRVFARNKAEIEADCLKWAKKIEKDFRPELVVFIAKSGFLFAKPLAEYFDCPMVDITVSRPGNGGKDAIRKLVPKMPQKLLFALLRSKANYGYQEENSEREVHTGERFDLLDWENYRNILIVDDSTDTGYSLLAAKEAVQKVAPDSDVRTASYCVIDISKKRVSVDYGRYRNTIVVSATSRYSKEYDAFVTDLGNWKQEHI